MMTGPEAGRDAGKSTIDHVFICCAEGAPEAAALAALGLREGPPNTHPGQGTACRRFFFRNAYLELLWVSDPNEARDESVRDLRLWDRWSARDADACPFGIILRPDAADDSPARPPFDASPHRPAYLPDGLSIDIGRGTPLSEPALFFLGFARPPDASREALCDHALPLRELKMVDVGRPGDTPASDALTSLIAQGLLSLSSADRHTLTLTFDEGRLGRTADLRPHLPLRLRW